MRKVISVEYSELILIRIVNLPFPRDTNNEAQNLTSPSCPQTPDQAPSRDVKGPANKSRFIKLFLAGTGFLPFMFARLARKNNVNRNTDNKSVSVKSHTYKALLRNRHACSTQSVNQTQGRIFFCLLSTQ